MSKNNYNNLKNENKKSGIALIVVLLMLAILSLMAYTLTNRVMIQQGSEQYMIDYQDARYACDSAVKFALASIGDINEPNLIVRADAVDFSDLFIYDEIQYRQLLSDWALNLTPEQAKKYLKNETQYLSSVFDINDLAGINDPNNFSLLLDDTNEDANLLDVNSIDPNNLQIPGPYGPKWPLITEPINLEISNAKVTIEIHDENAKYPIGWMMLDDLEVRRQIVGGFETLCWYLDVNEPVVRQIEDELIELRKIKEYKTKFEKMKVKKTVREKMPARRSRRGRRRRSTRTRYRNVKKTIEIPAEVHLTDFAKLFNSSLLNTEALARPYYVTEDRAEAALKYISLWTTTKVNINSAPRPVLEAAFAFGGLSDSKELSQAVIEQRQFKPFRDPNDLRSELFGFGDAIDKCRQYISTKSNIFTIRITAKSGRAKVSAVILLKKDENKFQRIAVLSG